MSYKAFIELNSAWREAGEQQPILWKLPSTLSEGRGKDLLQEKPKVSWKNLLKLYMMLYTSYFIINKPLTLVYMHGMLRKGHALEIKYLLILP